MSCGVRGQPITLAIGPHSIVVAIATLISSIIDAFLCRSGTCPFPTVKRAAGEIQHVSFVFHRSTADITVVGPEGSAYRVFAYIDGIGLDPPVLFEKLTIPFGIQHDPVSAFDFDTIQEGVKVTS